MERNRIEYLKRKLKNIDLHQFLDLTDELLREGDQCPEEIWAVYRNRVSINFHPGANVLTKIIIKNKDIILYEISKEIIQQDRWATIDLLRARIPDSEIEKRICGYLDDKPGDLILRKAVLEVLKDYGSIECLGTLQAFEYHHDPDFKAAQVIIGSMSKATESEDNLSLGDWQKNLERTLAFEHGLLARKAIEAVSARNQPAIPQMVGHSISGSPFILARMHSEKASGKLDHDLGGALNDIRKATEALLKAYISSTGIIIKKPTPLDELLLSDLISIIQAESRLPKHIGTYLDGVQKVSNMGSHDQGKAHEEITSRTIVAGVIDQFFAIEKYLKDQLPNISPQKTGDI